MTPIRRALVAEDLAAEAIGKGHRAMLERAAPAYRRHFWPDHDRANRDWIQATRAIFCARSRPTSFRSHERLYGRSWFKSPVRVDIVWAGRAYTSLDPVTHATVSPPNPA